MSNDRQNDRKRQAQHLLRVLTGEGEPLMITETGDTAEPQQEDLGTSPTMAAELFEVLEHYGLSPEAKVRILALGLGMIELLATLSSLVDRWEAEGLARSGFSREVEAVILRHLTSLMQSDV